MFCTMAVGMGLTMAPATESVMGALPRDKAGVGSAVNDTTRQMGGALGVAIIGSVVSSIYASRVADVAGDYDLTGATLDVGPRLARRGARRSPTASASRPATFIDRRQGRRSSPRSRADCASARVVVLGAAVRRLALPAGPGARPARRLRRRSEPADDAGAVGAIPVGGD